MFFLAFGWVTYFWIPSKVRRVPVRISFWDWMEKYDPAHDFLYGEEKTEEK